MTQTVTDALRWASERLHGAGVGTPNRDARRLMAHVLSVDTARLSILGPEPLGKDEATRFKDLIARRVLRHPVSHLLGYRDFWKHRFRVSPDVLDPRPETETLVSVALEEPFDRVLELGVGSGAILISLLLERPDTTGVGTDISPEAVLIAGANAERLCVDDRITLPLSDWFDDVGGQYDLIISNPPYIAADEMEGLEPEVALFEPRVALTDEADGLTAYRTIAEQALPFLAPSGRILVEIGPTQGDAVRKLFSDAGFTGVIVHRDLDGRDRVVQARHPA